MSVISVKRLIKAPLLLITILTTLATSPRVPDAVGCEGAMGNSLVGGRNFALVRIILVIVVVLELPIYSDMLLVIVVLRLK